MWKLLSSSATVSSASRKSPPTPFFSLRTVHELTHGSRLCRGIQETLPRLTAMIRGMGDPLVAAYARAYLCRVSRPLLPPPSPAALRLRPDAPSDPQVGMEVAPHLKESLNANVFDLLATFRQISGDSVQKQLHVQKVEVPVYLTLYSPAINWILQCVAYRAPEVKRLSAGLNPNGYQLNESLTFIPSLFPHQQLLTEMMERCKMMANK